MRRLLLNNTHPSSPRTEYDYEGRSQAAGPLTEPPEDGRYRVRFRRLDGSRPVRSTLLVLAALLLPRRVPDLADAAQPLALQRGRAADHGASIVMTVTTGVIGLFAFLNLATLCRATLLARDPIPVRAEPGTRVAFVTTIVPCTEPIEMVVPTLEAALADPLRGRVRRLAAGRGQRPRGQGDLRPARREPLQPPRACPAGTRPRARSRRRSKHGNLNAWLDAHGDDYDVLRLGVDPDHVPLPNYAERLLGYFRDPDVAFVVGPQVYGNYEGFVVRGRGVPAVPLPLAAAEGGQPLAERRCWSAPTTRCGSARCARSGAARTRSPRTWPPALPCTAARNPQTPRRWTVRLHPGRARGRGGSFLLQRLLQPAAPLVARHRRGPRRQLWRVAHRLSPRALAHYSLLLCYYPTAAIAWVLGALNGLLYFSLGARRRAGAGRTCG